MMWPPVFASLYEILRRMARGYSMLVTAFSSYYSPVSRVCGMKSSWENYHWAYRIYFSCNNPVSNLQLHPEYPVLVSTGDETLQDISMPIHHLSCKLIAPPKFHPREPTSREFRAENNVTKVFEITSLRYWCGPRILAKQLQSSQSFNPGAGAGSIDNGCQPLFPVLQYFLRRVGIVREVS